MKVTDSIHLIKIEFRLNAELRFVNVYLILGEKLCLIDSGPFNGPPIIFNYLKSIGYSPEDIALIINTHAHADHIGGNAEIKKLSKARIAAHALAAPWIEDINLQYRERSVPAFYSLVEEPTKVDMFLSDEDLLDLGRELTLKVIHSPGHSPGSICLYCEKDHALFTGDCIPAHEGIGIYSDVKLTLKSIEKLRKISSIAYLLSAWYPPVYSREVYIYLTKTVDYITSVHSVILDSLRKRPMNLNEITETVFHTLGVGAEKIIPIRITTIDAHLKALLAENKIKKLVKNGEVLWTASDSREPLEHASI